MNLLCNYVGWLVMYECTVIHVLQSVRTDITTVMHRLF